MPEDSSSSLATVAHELGERETIILDRWREHARREPELAEAVASLAQTQFDDHIPAILEAFCDDLRRGPEKILPGFWDVTESRHLELHGLHRWQQGYQLHQLTREWGLLQLVLLEEVDSLQKELPEIDDASFATVRHRLARLCSDGLSQSAAEYWRLHQVEAAGHVRDLEEAIGDLRALEDERLRTWREAAHDLRGSLQNVESATRLLDREDADDEAKARFSTLLQRSVRSLRDLLEDLLDLARLDAGQEELEIATFDASEVLRELVQVGESVAASRGLTLTAEGPPSLSVEGDRGKVRRVVQNLLLNALKYTKEGEVRLVWCADDDEGERWVFYVMDTGPGFDSGSAAPLGNNLVTASHAAQRVVVENAENHTAKESKEPVRPPTLPAASPEKAETSTGEGIGLSIVKRLCEVLHAAVELETGSGRGSTFRVTLPRRYVAEG